jgi:serine/threonine-protein kinase
MTGTSAGSKDDYSFGQVAIRENFCSFEQVKECLDIQSKLRGLGIEPKKLGEILIEKGYLTPEQAVKIAKSQIQAQSQSSQKVIVPGYEILSKIGQGAMGVVYKARQVSMDRVVAIKVLSPKYSKDRPFVERFVREARAVARLNHENIISGIDVGETHGIHYFVMEYVDGVPASSVLKREGRLDERRCLNIGLQIARALAHAHKHGIVHRDVKPENIMLTSSGTAKLCDLGLAKQTKGEADVTMDGTSVGTPNYISPEQARGEERIDTRSDIYSLGASLYHLSTGGPPFSGPNPMVVMTKHVTEFADPPKKRCPALSEGFSNLVMKMLQKRREDRYQDPDALVADIAQLLDGGDFAPAAGRKPSTVARPSLEPIRRAPTTAHHHLRPRASSSPVPVVLAGAAVAVVVAVYFLFSGGSGSSPASTGPRPDPPKPVAGNSGPAPADPGDRLQRDVQAFRDLVDGQIGNAAKSERFTEPYTLLLRKIDQCKAATDIVGLKTWQQELAAYTDKVNQAVDAEWQPIKKQADEHFAGSRYAQALEALGRLQDVYKWLKTEPPSVRTRAGEEHEASMTRVRRALEDLFLTEVEQVQRLFQDPAKRREAYEKLDMLAGSATADQKKDIEKRRKELFEREVGEILVGGATPERLKKALDRVAELRAQHGRNAAATALLDAEAARLRTLQSDAASSLSSQAAGVYGAFRPQFEDALKQRDLVKARQLLYTVYFAKETAPLQSILLPGSTDLTALKAFLDPARAAPADARRVLKMAEEGHAVARRPGQSEAARDLYADLRTAALLDELLEMAVEGAKVAGREPARFKPYSAPLRDATAADPAPRKPGEAPSLQATLPGGSKVVLFLAPSTSKPCLTEDDLVALAKRAPAAANDPHFPLRAFYLYIHGGKPAGAKYWYDSVPPEQRELLGRFLDQLKGAVSLREEQEAERLYTEAGALWQKNKNDPVAARKFRECVEKYANTEYMKKVVTLATGDKKSRLQIVEDHFPAAGKPKGARPTLLRDVFGTADVRDLGGRRFEVTYGFKDDRESAMFAQADGTVVVTRPPGGAGLQLSGQGMWCWNVPLKGNATIEASFRMAADGAFGMLLHATPPKSGYLAVVDLALGGNPLDAIFRLPVQEGAQWLTSVLAQGGKGELAVPRGTPLQASFSREGTKLRFAMPKGSIECDNPQFNEGRPGLALIVSSLLLERVRITGEVDGAWLDAELRKAEAAGK